MKPVLTTPEAIAAALDYADLAIDQDTRKHPLWCSPAWPKLPPGDHVIGMGVNGYARPELCLQILAAEVRRLQAATKL